MGKLTQEEFNKRIMAAMEPPQGNGAKPSGDALNLLIQKARERNRQVLNRQVR